VTVKEFLIWKSKKIIREQKADVADKKFSLLEKEILDLSNKSEPKSGTYDLKPSEVVESYKNLKEVEMLFDDLKNFVDIRPIRHWLQVRERAHVFICVLALLLKQIFEIHYLRGKCTMEPLEKISKSKLIKYKVKFSKREDRSQTFPKVTNTTPLQKKHFNMIGIRNPMSLEKFIW
jgi:transposase